MLQTTIRNTNLIDRKPMFKEKNHGFITEEPPFKEKNHDLHIKKPLFEAKKPLFYSIDEVIRNKVLRPTIAGKAIEAMQLLGIVTAVEGKGKYILKELDLVMIWR